MFEHHGGTASRRDAGQERPPAAHGQGPGQIRRGRVRARRRDRRDACRSAALQLRTVRHHGFRMPPSARSAAPEGFSCLLQRFGAGDADVDQQVVAQPSRGSRSRARSCQAKSCSTIAVRRPSWSTTTSRIWMTERKPAAGRLRTCRGQSRWQRIPLRQVVQNVTRPNHLLHFPFQGIAPSLTGIVLACFTKMSLRAPDGFSCFWRVCARFQGFQVTPTCKQAWRGPAVGPAPRRGLTSAAESGRWPRARPSRSDRD